MKIVTVVGARPQFIKAAAFSRRLRDLTDWQEVIVHTGQHYDTNMSAVFFEEMNIPVPDYHFAIHTLPREQMIGEMQAAILEVLHSEKPDLVLVYGDTNSTLAGALAARAAGIKLAHVEAGLRSFNKTMPEELNRIETDTLSDFLFVPSHTATENLKREGRPLESIFEVGDIMLDAVNFYSQQLKEKSYILERISTEPYILLTLHRQENTDDPDRLRMLMKAVDEISRHSRILFPIHPRTRAKMNALGISTNAETIDPVGYFDMLALIKNSSMVMTDSGGLQKEAFYLKKFCITLREETEWVELVEIGANKVVGCDTLKIQEAFRTFQSNQFSCDSKPYGEGDTGERIIAQLKTGWG